MQAAFHSLISMLRDRQSSLCATSSPLTSMKLVSHCNHTLVVQQCVLFLALLDIMAKTSFSTALAFWSGVFMATTDSSLQAGKSVCGHDAHPASSPDAQELGIFHDLCLSTFTTPAA